LARLPVISARDALKVLRKLGFRVLRQTGSHIHLWSDQRQALATVPNHAELAKGTLISIFKQAKVSREEFLKEL